MGAGSFDGRPRATWPRPRPGRRAAAALAAVMAVGIVPTASPPVARGADFPATCPVSTDFLSRADELLGNRYLLVPHPVVTLPANPTWGEDPLRDPNWLFQYHTLRFTLNLLRAWQETGVMAYRDRALFLLRDWYLDNPRADPASTSSWAKHATGWRGLVYACAADLVPMEPWLRDALLLHGRVLADPDFYVKHGNHALNQAIGLLAVGRVLGRTDWMTLARDRINALVLESVDSQGVTNEQSIGYQAYNYRQYRYAQERLLESGLVAGSGFERIALMPWFMAQATLPNGHAEMIGDTGADAFGSVPGTWLEFVATQGRSGPTPPLVKAYRAGYQFARSGWGTTRAFGDETFTSVRWGPGSRLHGHPDGTSLTLYAWGSRLIVDSGKYSYTRSKWRDFFLSRRAHNVVTVDGLRWRDDSPTTLLGRTTTSALVDVRLKTNGYSGVTQLRRITWSRGLDYLVVEDRLSSTTVHTYRQLWHLVEDANPAVGTADVRTMRASGNVLIRQLAGSPKLRIVTGARDPVQGWVSYDYNKKVAAPVVEAVRRGSSVRYLTLIVPAENRPRAEVTGLRLTGDGYRLTIAIDGCSERVVASGSGISITPLGGCAARGSTVTSLAGRRTTL